MGKEGVSGSVLYISEEKCDSPYPMCLGVSCAFFVLGLLTRPDEVNNRIPVLRNFFHENAHPIELLVWKVLRATNEGNSELLWKLETARRKIDELKRIRSEDAKANEKVVGIFNTREQSWLNERRKLQQHIESLMNERKFSEEKNEEAIAELNEKLKEMERLVQSKEKVLADEAQMRKELEEELAKAKNAAKELQDIVKTGAEEHSSEIWKHKTAFVELVSNQRQLEAELGRALRQVENAKHELNMVLEKKDESVLLVQKLSAEVIKTTKDLERKEKILSAMTRKSKLEAAEKKMLTKELQSSKIKRKQVEFESENWKSMSESKNERHLLKNILVGKAKLRRDTVSGAQGLQLNLSGLSHNARTKSNRNDRDSEHENTEIRESIDVFPPTSDPSSGEESEELAITASVKRMEGRVQSEADKYTAEIEQRHQLELDAFAEQMWLKDEKLEALRQQFLHMDLEAKQMKSHAQGWHQDISQLRDDNMRLKTSLLDREDELNIMKEQLASQPKIVSIRKTNLKSSLPDPTLVHGNIWSKVKTNKKKIREEEIEKEKIIQVDLPEEKTRKRNEKKTTIKLSRIVSSPVQAAEEIPVEKRGPQSNLNPVHAEHETKGNPGDISASSSQLLSKKTGNQSKMDLHALGISYKIKRLKQQLLFVESLIKKQENGNPIRDYEGGANEQGFYSLISLLSRQVGRYQSLQGKAENLCKRMQECKLDANHGNFSVTRTKGNTRTLEQLLEETFQLQRYIVATGQKLMEVHSKISSEYVGITEEHKMVASFDIKKFGDNSRTLLQDVQRGLEVQISWIIGDLEGTLACNGMIQLRR